MGFFLLLIEPMTRRQPELRPTAEEALAQWQRIRERVPYVHRAWRPRPRDDDWASNIVFDTYSLLRGVYYGSRWIFDQAASNV